MTTFDGGSAPHSSRRSLNKRGLPGLPTPGESLRERIDLIIVASGERQQLGNKRVEPGGILGQQYRSALEQVDLFACMGAATAKIVGGCRLRDGGQTQDFIAGIAIQEVANEVIDMDPLHHDDNAGGLLVV